MDHDARRSARHGSPARRLITALRAGTLDLETLALAAYCDLPGAHDAHPDPPSQPATLETWVRGLARWGHAPCVCAALAAADLTLPDWTHERPHDTRPNDALDAVRAWLAADDPRRLELQPQLHAHAELAHLALEDVAHDLTELSGAERARRLARGFRQTRAATQATLCAANDPARAPTHAVLAAVAAREDLVLADVPLTASLHVRASLVDRLGELPELDDPPAAHTVRQALALALRRSPALLTAIAEDPKRRGSPLL